MLMLMLAEPASMLFAAILLYVWLRNARKAPQTPKQGTRTTRVSWFSIISHAWHSKWRFIVARLLLQARLCNPIQACHSKHWLFDLYKASAVIMVAILVYTDNQNSSVCIICKSRVAYCTHSVNLFD
jgi:hypothetical protein